jgi:hypothetical protein
MRKAFLILLCVVILIGVSAVILNRHLSHIYGPYYDPSNSRDLQKLLAIVDGSRPLREALERFKNDQGDYPTTVTNLFPSYLQTKNAPEDFNIKDWAGWEYNRESTNSYELFYQLDWDGGLWFDHSVDGTNQWSWSTSDRVVDLTQKVQQR